jgi:hypothetical protein
MSRRHLSGAAVGSLVLLYLLIGALSHSYRGLTHDARLYTLQALNQLDPSSLGQDVFLHFGSQDRFTIFSPLYAASIQLLGIDHAAAALTLILQIAVAVAAFLLARAVMPTLPALLGLGILIAIPGDYGPERIFTCIEQVLTPRMASEAMVLASLAAALANRHCLAVLLTVSAALFHPIMAAAGFAALGIRYIAIPKPALAYSVIALATAIALTVMVHMPAGQWGKFDPLWFDAIKERSPHLFLSFWTLSDWGNAAVATATLLVGILSLPDSRTRTLCQISLATIVSGLILTLFACDFLHLVLFVQVQPWRWQWLGTVSAALALPMILATQWRSTPVARASCLFLASAWIFGSDTSALLAALIAIVCQVLSPKCTVRQGELFFYGSCGMIIMALTWRVATNLTFAYSVTLDQSLGLPLRHLISFCHDGLILVIAICCACWLLLSQQRARPVLLSALCIAAGAALLPPIFRLWTVQQYPPAMIGQFASWRAIIPPGAQVYWPESPVFSWILLDRPNFTSGLQSSGVVFSRPATVKLQQRAKALGEYIPPSATMSWELAESAPVNSPQTLQGICRLGVFDFLVAHANLDLELAALQPGKSALDTKTFRLYRCSPQARAAAAAT